MARGIDVEQVTIVINYDLPTNPETRNIDFDNSVSTFLNLQCFSDCCLSIYNRYDGHVSNDHIVCLLNIGPPSFFSEQNIVGSKI